VDQGKAKAMSKLGGGEHEAGHYFTGAIREIIHREKRIGKMKRFNVKIK